VRDRRFPQKLLFQSKSAALFIHLSYHVVDIALHAAKHKETPAHLVGNEPR